MDKNPERETPFFKTKAGIGLISAVAVVAAAAIFAFTGGSDQRELTPDPVATSSLGSVDAVSPSSPPVPAGSPEATGGAETQAPGQESSQSPQQPAADSPAAIPGATGPVRVGDHAQGPTVGAWEPAGEAYGKAWADPSGGHADWLERMKPYITPEMHMSYTYTDIANITARDFKQVIIIDEGPRTRDFKILYEDGYALLAQAEIQNDGTWLVSKSLPADH